MSNEMKKNDRVMVQTPKFRVSFPAVFEPKLPPGKTDPKDAKFSICMLYKIAEVAGDTELDKKNIVDIEPVKAAIRQVMINKFGPNKDQWPKNYKNPLRSGMEDAKKDQDGYGEGIVFASASAKREYKPGLIDHAKQPITEPSKFYGGCYARATLSVYWYDKGVNKGVAFGLQNIQKWHDGEPFSGRNKPENDFDALDNPTPADMDGAGAQSSAEKKDPLGL